MQRVSLNLMRCFYPKPTHGLFFSRQYIPAKGEMPVVLLWCCCGVAVGGRRSPYFVY